MALRRATDILHSCRVTWQASYFHFHDIAKLALHFTSSVVCQILAILNSIIHGFVSFDTSTMLSMNRAIVRAQNIDFALAEFQCSGWNARVWNQPARVPVLCMQPDLRYQEHRTKSTKDEKKECLYKSNDWRCYKYAAEIEIRWNKYFHFDGVIHYK